MNDVNVVSKKKNLLESNEGFDKNNNNKDNDWY